MEEELRLAKRGMNGGKSNDPDDFIDNKYAKTLKKLKTTGDKFTDQEFPPTAVSLIQDWWDKGKLVRSLVDDWKEFKWIRADQIPSFNSGDAEDKLAVFKGMIEPADIL